GPPNDGMSMGAQPGFGGGATGYGGAPGFGGPPATSFGGPPQAPSFGGPPPPSGGLLASYGTPAAAPAAGPPPASQDMSPAEVMRMQRRIDQLQSEVRLLRGGGDKSVRMEELEEKLSR